MIELYYFIENQYRNLAEIKEWNQNVFLRTSEKEQFVDDNLVEVMNSSKPGSLKTLETSRGDCCS